MFFVSKLLLYCCGGLRVVGCGWYMPTVGMLSDVDSRDSITAAQSFLLVAPAAANPRLFANFTRVVNDYLEQPPFNFKNTHKHLGVLKKVRDDRIIPNSLS